MDSHYKSLVEPLAEQAQQSPQRIAVVLVLEDGSRETITAQELHRDAVSTGHAFGLLGINPGDIVLLALNHSRFLISAIWGALHAGAVPSVLPYLSDKMQPSLYRERLRLMVAHCEPKWLITFARYRESLSEILLGTGCRVIGQDELLRYARQSIHPDSTNYRSEDQMAVLQFSSGTTGIQKGVAFSHRAVLDQVQAIRQTCRFTADDVIVTWAPLYHDMGLVAAMMLSMGARIRLVLLSPFAWVRSPRILLDAIDEFRGTVSFMPNFGFNHCVNSLRDTDLEGLDLSCCRFLVNGGEQVMRESLQRFARKFGPFGFRPSALGAAYGTTENASSVTITPIGHPPRVDWVDNRQLQQTQQAVPTQPESWGSIPVVSCGCPLPGIELKVTDAHGQERPERYVGEIITRSKTMVGSYYRRPDLMHAAFRDGWYRTGDLGYLACGQLYLCGRKSDVIIIGGKNIYPHDIEHLVGQTAEVKAGQVVAFGVPDERMGTEKLVIVAELSKVPNAEQKRQAERDIRRNVAQQIGVSVGDLRLVTGKWVIKSTSGKIARGSNRAKYMQLLQDG
jgi:fatty-acyl-CoA synthase